MAECAQNTNRPFNRHNVGRFAAVIGAASLACVLASTPVHARCTTVDLGNDFVSYRCADGRSGTAVDIGGRFTGRKSAGGLGVTTNLGGGIMKKLFGRKSGISKRVESQKTGRLQVIHLYGGQAGLSIGRATKITDHRGPLFDRPGAAPPRLAAARPARRTGTGTVVAVSRRGRRATGPGRFRNLSDLGNVNARMILSAVYDKSKDISRDSDPDTVTQDPLVRWYRKAAARGNARIQYDLGLIYDAGVLGVPRDHGEALRWYMKAAELGHADSQHTLGYMFATGEGVKRDDVQAHFWLDIAASSQPPGDARERGAKNRDIVARKLTPAGIAEARRLARAWRATHRKGREVP